MEHELMVLLAATMTRKEILERIEEAISELREAELLGDEKEIHAKSHHLALSCSLFMLHMTTDGDVTKAMETIQRIGRMRRRDKIFDIDDDKKN